MANGRLFYTVRIEFATECSKEMKSWRRKWVSMRKRSGVKRGTGNPYFKLCLKSSYISVHKLNLRTPSDRFLSPFCLWT